MYVIEPSDKFDEKGRQFQTKKTYVLKEDVGYVIINLESFYSEEILKNEVWLEEASFSI